MIRVLWIVASSVNSVNSTKPTKYGRSVLEKVAKWFDVSEHLIQATNTYYANMAQLSQQELFDIWAKTFNNNGTKP